MCFRPFATSYDLSILASTLRLGLSLSSRLFYCSLSLIFVFSCRFWSSQVNYDLVRLCFDCSILRKLRSDCSTLCATFPLCLTTQVMIVSHPFFDPYDVVRSRSSCFVRSIALRPLL